MDQDYTDCPSSPNLSDFWIHHLVETKKVFADEFETNDRKLVDLKLGKQFHKMMGGELYSLDLVESKENVHSISLLFRVQFSRVPNTVRCHQERSSDKNMNIRKDIIPIEQMTAPVLNRSLIPFFSVNSSVSYR